MVAKSELSGWKAWTPFLGRIGTYFGLLTAALMSIVYIKQERILYHPAVPNEKFRYPKDMPSGFRSPKEYGMSYEDVYITTKDNVKLHAWFIKAGSNPKAYRTLVFFPGNAGNIGCRLPNLFLLMNSLGMNILILAYRGYGHSEGTPSE